MAHPDPVRIEGFRGDILSRPTAGWPDEAVAASGPFRFTPHVIVVPTGVEDVQALVRWAGENGRTLTPRGAATGMPGGNVGPDVLVDLRRGFRRVLSLDPSKQRITVQPGVTISEVETAAAAHGLTFPVQPSSLDRCVVGGLVANNAAGPRSFRHGAAREWIVEAEVVLVDGGRRRLRSGERGGVIGDPNGTRDPLREAFDAVMATAASDRPERRAGDANDPGGARGPWEPGIWDDWPAVRKNSSGYAIDRLRETGAGIDLFVGSEGTLGIATEVTLELTPSPPERSTVVVAVDAIDEVPSWASLAGEIGASACEFLDRRVIELAALERDPELATLTRGAGALVLIELEGAPAALSAASDTLRATARARGSRVRAARNAEEAHTLWTLRRRASPAIRDAASQGLRSMQFIEDSVVPPPQLGAYVQGVRRILARAETDGAIFGHAGDANVHVNPLVDLRRSDWPARVRAILEETVALVVDLGGTLAGEHGDGRVRAPYLERVWGPSRTAAFRALKERLDPQGTLNPGVILPLTGQDPLEGLAHLERSGA